MTSTLVTRWRRRTLAVAWAHAGSPAPPETNRPCREARARLAKMREYGRWFVHTWPGWNGGWGRVITGPRPGGVIPPALGASCTGRRSSGSLTEMENGSLLDRP